MARTTERIIPLLLILTLVTGGFAGRNISDAPPISSNRSALSVVGDSLGACPDGWDTSFTTNGVNGQVNAIVVDGSGNYYIGGNFTAVQGVPAAGIAKWNGTTWSALGSGVNGPVYAIAVSGNEVYIGGDFNSPVTGGMARNVAKWDGSTWTPLGSGLGGGTHIVKAVAVYNGEAYFGGNFTTSDGSPFSWITKWNGTSFQSAGNLVGDVKALAQANGLLYAGGAIGLLGGTQIGIASFDGTTWSPMGTRANSDITAIAVSGSNLYVVGGIFLPGVSQGAQFGRFNGTSWTIAGQFGISNMNAVTAIGDDVYIGGSFTGGYQNIAKWNGTSFVNFGTNGIGLTGGTSSSRTVSALAADGNKLLVGGNFTLAGNVGASNIASNLMGEWLAFSGTGLNSAARAIAVSGSDVYVGGSFVSAGSASARGIARWDGTTWHALGTGIQGTVNAAAVAGNKLYAGGNFTSAGGSNASRIAVWNGQSWSALGSGVNGTVTAIVVRGEDVYVGGDFQTAGGLPANRIAKWNGSSWSGFPGASVPNTVTGMGFIGNDLYVSSDTTTVDNPNYLLKYDGTNWTGLAVGMGGHGVRSMAISGTDIYVSGGFQAVGGITAHRVAKWNGSQWSALGSGIPGNTNAVLVAVAGNDLIATGDFTNAGGADASRIARWNGTEWSALGSGLDDQAITIAAAGGDIFAGGNFNRAGCNASPYFARYRNLVWSGTTNTDWHTASNWGNGSVPSANAGVSVSASDISISSADVIVSSLVVLNGRTVTIGAGRTLTVNGDLGLSSGSITGPGDLVVNGGLRVGGNIDISGSVTLNGDLYLSGGILSPVGGVDVTACHASAIAGGSTVSFVVSKLTRCVGPGAAYRFPVGSGGVYSPVDVSSITGNGQFSITPKTGPYSGSATGLPANRLQRWWDLDASGISQASLVFDYLESEVIGVEGRYRAYTIGGGSASLITTLINRDLNTASVLGLTTFSDITLAEGPINFEILKGRIRTPAGRGTDRVVVSLTDDSGNVRYAVSNNVGYYRFLGVETWKNYTIRLLSKKYTFLPPERTIEFVDFAPDQNFVSTDH